MLVNVHKQIILLSLLLVGFLNGSAQVWTIQQCIDTALVHNKNLQIDKNKILIGEQKEKEAKANLIPKITGNLDYKYFSNLPYQLLPLSTFNQNAPEGQFKEAQFGVPHNINANLQLAMPLYNPNLLGAIKVTEIATELSVLQYQKTEEQIVFEVFNLYYNSQILHNQLAFIDSNLTNASRLLKTVTLLNEQLLARRTDVNKVELQLAQLITLKESIQNKYEQVLNSLKFIIGVSIDQNIQIEPKIQYQNTNDYSVIPTLDIKISKTQRHILETELGTLNKSRYFPSINLFGTYGTTGFGYNGQVDRFLNFYPIGFAGIQMSYPVFNGTVTHKKINQKRLELQNSDLQFDLILEHNSLLEKNAFMQRNIAKKSVETSAKQIEFAQTIYEQTLIQQKNETSTLTEVLLADNALREAQQTYLNAIIEYLKADIDLKKLSGNISTTK
jgi:outer membrane protein TolC